MPRPTRELSVAAAAAVPLALVTGALTLADADVSDTFSYTLDDPYVHLELARMLALGEHGVNPGEFAAPSSSVLWPLLLVPWWWLGVDPILAPLALAALSALLTVLGLTRACTLVLGDAGTWGTRAGIVLLLSMIANVPALVLSGMEHMLQVALTTWFAVGLMAADDDAPLPRGWPVVAAALPLVRFEDLGVVLVALAWLGWRGQARAAAAIALAAVVPVGLYVTWLHGATGHWLPSSVLSKGAMFPSAWQTPLRPAVFLPVLLSGWTVARTSGRARDLPVIALLAVLGHVALAQVGLFHRYITYVHVLAVLLGAWSLRDVLRGALDVGGEARRLVLWVLSLMAVVNAKATWDTWGAQQQILRLHGQLHRLATEHLDGAIAVNDIGWVGYRNDRYVLDLVGLASLPALEHHLAGDDPAWMDALARAHDVRAIAIYRHWFGELPPAWVPVGTLVVDWSSYAPDERRVLVLAPSAEAVAPLRQTLAAWADGLPDGARWVPAK